MAYIRKYETSDRINASDSCDWTHKHISTNARAVLTIENYQGQTWRLCTDCAAEFLKREDLLAHALVRILIGSPLGLEIP
jgi:hypothetical protein